MKPYLIPEQYLEIERKAEFKSEYCQGEMFAMPRVRLAHVQIVANAMRELGNQLAERPCQPLCSDMRVCVKPAGFYTYPDVLVVCGKPQFQDESYDDTLLNPTVIVEVLTKSSEEYDRGPKFEQYRSLESLSEYLLISSWRVLAELFTREPDGTWSHCEKASLEDSLHLQPVDCHLLLTDLYEKVEFPQPPS
jgi:Uma2 family endonuclease